MTSVTTETSTKTPKRIRAIKAAQRRGRAAGKRRRLKVVKALTVDQTPVLGMQMLTLAQVCAATGLSRSTIWRATVNKRSTDKKKRDARYPRFPKPMMVGPRVPRWTRSDVVEYMRALREIAGLPELPAGT